MARKNPPPTLGSILHGVARLAVQFAPVDAATRAGLRQVTDTTFELQARVRRAPTVPLPPARAPSITIRGAVVAPDAIESGTVEVLDEEGRVVARVKGP